MLKQQFLERPDPLQRIVDVTSKKDISKSSLTDFGFFFTNFCVYIKQQELLLFHLSICLIVICQMYVPIQLDCLPNGKHLQKVN